MAYLNHRPMRTKICFEIPEILTPDQGTVRTEIHEQNISPYQQIILIDLSWRLNERYRLTLSASY